MTCRRHRRPAQVHRAQLLAPARRVGHAPRREALDLAEPQVPDRGHPPPLQLRRHVPLPHITAPKVEPLDDLEALLVEAVLAALDRLGEHLGELFGPE